MKAIVNNDLLLKELKKMSILIKKNHIIPITSCVLMNFEKNKLTITATDLETTYISVIDCDCKSPFSVPVDHNDITDFSSNAAAPVQFELKEKQIILVSGKFKRSLTIAGDADHFPKSPEDEFSIKINVEGEFFYNLSKANVCRADGKIPKVNLDMAAIDVKTGSVIVVGCDGNYLFKKEMDCKSKTERVVMVSDTFVQSCKSFQESTLSFGERCVKAECKNETVISVLGVQKYANYEVVLPKGREYNLRVDSNEFKKAVRSITNTTNVVSKECYFNFSDGRVQLTSSNIDFGKEGETEIDVTHTVTIPKLCLNLFQLSLLLGLVDDNEIEFSIESHDKSVLFRPVEDHSILFLIQPLLIN